MGRRAANATFLDPQRRDGAQQVIFGMISPLWCMTKPWTSRNSSADLWSASMQKFATDCFDIPVAGRNFLRLLQGATHEDTPPSGSRPISPPDGGGDAHAHA